MVYVPLLLSFSSLIDIQYTYAIYTYIHIYIHTHTYICLHKHIHNYKKNDFVYNFARKRDDSKRHINKWHNHICLVRVHCMRRTWYFAWVLHYSHHYSHKVGRFLRIVNWWGFTLRVYEYMEVWQYWRYILYL